MDFSIIIPIKEINNYIKESISYTLNLDHKSFEIIILPDYKENIKFKKTRIIPTGQVGPAEKRDLGAKIANGKYLAFIDDDAFPRNDWLTNALPHFKNENISAVVGPGVTPSSDSLSQKISGLVFELGAGKHKIRYTPGKKQYVEDYPSCNFIIRKEIFNKLKGFDTTFWPGEDTKFCLDLINIGKKIFYDPSVLVYHHRRKLLLPHLKQVWQYSIHRGYFVKKFPKTSLKLNYFIPFILLFVLILGLIFSFFNDLILNLYLVFIVLYSLYLFYIFIRTSPIFLGLPVAIVTFLTHLTYGLGFIKGILTRKLLK